MKKIDLKNVDFKKISKEKILLLGLAGILLLGTSYFGSIKDNKQTGFIDTSNMEYGDKMENKLKSILETINGVSEVSVFITCKEEDGYLTKTESTNIEGVALTAKGIGENKETIINIISTLFNVPVHKISVVEIY